MICKVYTTGSDNYVYMNPNCNMKLIYEFLRVISEIPDNYEIDLCSESGYLLGIYDAECSSSGLTYLKPRCSYFIFIFGYEEDKPELFDPRPLMNYTDEDFSTVFGLIKRRFGIPKEEYINEEDAELIFEHMLMAYEERMAIESSPFIRADDVRSVTFFDSAGATTTKKASRKSSKTTGPCRVLQIWREEKRAKIAAQAPSEELLESYHTARRKSRKSLISFPEMSLGNQTAMGEEAEDEHEKQKPHKQKRHSVTKKGKKGDKKKKAMKDTDRVPEKEDDLLHKAVTYPHLPRVDVTPDNSRVSIVSNKETNFNLGSLKDIRVCVTVREFFRSHSSSTLDLLRPPAERSEDEKPDQSQVVGKRKSNRHIFSKKRSNKTK